MKNIFTILLTCFSLISFSQEKLEKLKAPSSPAANILDLQPSAILTPKSYKALETAIFSNFLGNSGNVTVPNDFALEFSPFWLSSHNPIELQDYLYPKFSDQLKRNASISIASTQNFFLGDSTKTNAISLGYRTSIYIPNEEDKNKVINETSRLDNLKAIQGTISNAMKRIIDEKDSVKTTQQALNELEKVIQTYPPGYRNDKLIKSLKAKLPELNLGDSITRVKFKDSIFSNTLSRAIKGETNLSEFKDYLKNNRTGFYIDFAAAGLINFPTNDFNKAYIPKVSLWLTPRWKTAPKKENSKKESFSFLGVLRYEWHNTSYYRRFFPGIEIYETNFDFGVATNFEYKKFAVNIEVVGRLSETENPAGTSQQGQQLFTKDTNSDIQYVGTITYNLTDQIVLTYNLGKKFDPLLNPTNTIVSLLGLNFGFGSPTVKDINLSK